MANTAKFKVPQQDGEIVIRHDGDEPITYQVAKGIVEVAAEHGRDVLNGVPGATPVAAGSPSKEE